MRIVMFVRNDVTVDARVLKEAGSLRDAGHGVTIVGIPRPGALGRIEREVIDGFEIVRVPIPDWRRWWRWLRAPSRLWSIIRRRSLRAQPGERMDGLDWLAMWRFGTLGWARAAARVAGPADAYHGHDLTGLPAAVFARRLHRPAARLVYDSHELYLESGAAVGRPSWAVTWLDRRERAWASEADALVTVSDGYAAHLGPRLGVGRVVIVHNCPPRAQADTTRENLIREATGIPADRRIVLYHGGFRPGRGVQELLAAILDPTLADVHLVFLGFGPLQPQVEAAISDPRYAGRVHLLPPAPPLDVVRWVASADVAAMAIQPQNFSYELSTPNKMFEAIAAGTPIAASDLPGMRSILMEDPNRPLGDLFNPGSPRAIAAAIRALLDLPPAELAAMGERSRAAARDRWNWEAQSRPLIELYDDFGTAA
jgi:glycosyltransferase involved in cell wall biosynthesis